MLDLCLRKASVLHFDESFSLYPIGEKLPQSTSALSAMLLLMMMTMTILINPSDAQENEEDAETLAELERMKQEWFNPEFEPQTLKPEQLWFFNQVRFVCASSNQTHGARIR